MSKLRKSTYLIAVPLDGTEQYMFLHGYTGAIDIVNNSVASFFQTHTSFEEDEIPFSKQTIERLITRGYITKNTASEEREYVRRFASLLHKDARNSSKKYLFLVSYNCNFRCPYCYEGGISGQGKQWTKQAFTREMIDKAYQAMAEIEPDENKRSKMITLYGGEPFLKENIDIVEYIIRKGVELGYHFDAITNGYDLNHFIPIFKNGAVTNLQITLDGSKEMHDKRRYHYQTHESFDEVFRNIGLALENNIAVSVRFNADANNFKEIEKLKKLFKEAGYSEKSHFRFSPAILRGGETHVSKDSSLLNNLIPDQARDAQADIAYLSRKEFNDLLEKFGLNASHHDYGLYHRLSIAIKNNSYLRFQSVFCGVQANMYIFDPYGDLYNCWETVGVRKHVLGSYKNGIQWTEEVKNWQDRNVGTTPKCSACKFALLCGGGCVAKALRHGGSFQASYCDNYAEIVKLTLNQLYKDWQKAKIEQTK